MDVTKDNLSQNRADILESLRDCCFVAVDCEFTGLDLPLALHPLDTTAERYRKLKNGVRDYLVLQVGLSFWIFDAENSCYRVKNYNFYTFPSEDSRHRFWAQSSSLAFLVAHGFDLNKCVREGLSWLHPAEYQKRKEQIRGKHLHQLKNLLERPEEELLKILNEETSVEVVHALPTPQNVIRAGDSSAEDYIINNWNSVDKWFKSGPKKDEIFLPPCNDFVRIAAYRHIDRICFNRKFNMESSRADKDTSPGMKRLRLFKADTTPFERLINSQRKERSELEASYGLSDILKALSESRKPLVGHNGQRDVLHILSQFIADLPDDYGEFQELCREVFPAFFDTRYMISLGVIRQYFRNGRLMDIFNQVKAQAANFSLPELVIKDGYGYNDASREHEAGFDAWMTGYIFAALAQFILPNKKGNFCKLDPNNVAILPFKNKLPFGSSLDITVMDLEQKGEVLDRDNVFIIEWPSSVESSHARAIMSLCGGFKKCGYGQNMLAFSPNVTDTVVNAIRNKKRLLKPCRVYKYGGGGASNVRSPRGPGSKQGSRSPPNMNSPNRVLDNSVHRSIQGMQDETKVSSPKRRKVIPGKVDDESGAGGGQGIFPESDW